MRRKRVTHTLAATLEVAASMARVFISHASEDKVPRVRTLVEALVHVSVPVWVDRPGAGDENLGLPADFIEKHDIRGLVAGSPWDDQILEAHRSCEAVLACISCSLEKERQVLVQEILLARYANKLVTCIVDDMPFDAVANDLGLASLSRTQAHRINTGRLARALEALSQEQMLEEDLLREWEVFLSIVRDIKSILRKHGHLGATEEELEVVRSELRQFPHGPMVRFFEVPTAILELFVERLESVADRRAHFSLSMRLALESKNPEDKPAQVTIAIGELMPIDQSAALDFWGQALAVAGSKSRRTLASFLLAPGPLGIGNLPADTSRQLSQFLAWLRDPQTSMNPIERSS